MTQYDFNIFFNYIYIKIQQVLIPQPCQIIGQITCCQLFLDGNLYKRATCLPTVIVLESLESFNSDFLQYSLLAKNQNPWYSNDTPGSFDCSEHHWINGSVISVSLTLTLGLKYEWANNMGVSMKHKAWVLWVIQRSNNQLKRWGNFRKLKGKLSGFH